ncbi:MAG: iron-containing alcohol dehydrogenase, partial [Clostridiales bacterium]|nr:iron-containing alcohol dehydrogenase [Clostridiales bacterium]
MKLKQFEITLNRKIYAGNHSLSKIYDIVKELDCKKVVVITDKNLIKTKSYEIMRDLVNRCGASIHALCDIEAEPSEVTISTLYQPDILDSCDLIIGFGGGSCIDCAKIISVLPNNPDFFENIWDTSLITKDGIPTLMIPTTAGTGAEATPNSILLNTKTNIKTGVISTKFIADYVILDPQVTVSLPQNLTVSTGFDALAHSIECYISKKATPFSDLYAEKSIQLVFENLELVAKEPDNLIARENMLLASYYGGVSIAASSTTAVHAMAYPLSSMFHMSHGLSIAVLLPYVMEYIHEGCSPLFEQLSYRTKLVDDNNNTSSQVFVNSLFELA